MKPVKLTRLLEFKMHCENWQEILGLTDWLITYQLDTLSPGQFALINYNTTTMVATLRLNKRWTKQEEMEPFAIHEMLHLCLANITTLAEVHSSDLYVSGYEHAAINRLISAFSMLNRIK